MKIIRDRQIVDDDFVHVPDGAELPASGKPIITLARYAKDGGALLERYPALGVRMPSDKLPGDVPNVGKLALIAIEFPRFSDGRGMSIARLLRQLHGFTGELRAVGWVLRDQMGYMERCGFNAYEMQPGKPLESGLEAFGELTVTYQADATERRPLYRRR